MRRRSVLIFGTTVAMIALSAAIAHACPMCKDSVPNSDASQPGGLPSGFNYSVYLLLTSFLVVLGGLMTFIVKSIRDTAVRPGFEVAPKPPSRS